MKAGLFGCRSLPIRSIQVFRYGDFIQDIVPVRIRHDRIDDEIASDFGVASKFTKTAFLNLHQHNYFILDRRLIRSPTKRIGTAVVIEKRIF